MYLRECLIENVGPIASLDVSLPLDANGRPKPVILVGKNGTGKTILLAYVLDALAELAKARFGDVVTNQRVGHQPFVKVTSGGDSRSLSGRHLCLLGFADAEHQFNYVEKIGNLDPEAYAERLRGRFDSVRNWPRDEPLHKRAVGNDGRIDSFFQTGAVCFFPASRHERPHWLNPDAVADHPLFADEPRVQGMLRKPLVVERSADENRRWLLDVMLDSLVDLDFSPSLSSHPGLPTGYALPAVPDMANKQLLKQGRRNVEELLRCVLEDPNARLHLNYRDAAFGRVAVRLGTGVVVPSLAHLSAGQALLFNLFATIIRYADRGDLNKSIHLDQIEGVVLVDEVDAHLHTDLQYDVLPRLLKLFPRVQFLVTSHAPLFLLGMEREFGPDGIQILEMPTGRSITTERFEEFRRSFECYRETRAFEDAVEGRVRAGAKPLVLVEGQTDVSYIRTALSVFGHHDLLAGLEIDEVGRSGRDGAKGGGHTNLDAARKFLETNQSRFPRRVLLLYDCDTRKPAESVGSLMIRAVPQNAANGRVVKGIENLLPDHLFEPRFYAQRKKPTGDGGENVISEFRKVDFCEWVCRDAADAVTFREFDQLLTPILREFLAAETSG